MNCNGAATTSFMVTANRLTERELIVRWHRTKEEVPNNGISIDATAPIAQVVDEIVRKAMQLDGWARRGRGANHHDTE